MASLRARSVSFLLRHTFKRQLARTADIQQVRRIMNARLYRAPGGVDILARTVANVPGEWVRPRQQQPIGTLLYLHGGGYIGCSPHTHRPYSCFFARQGWQVYVPDYRLAPEHPFPAAVVDARAVKAALAADEEAASRLVVAGDSAGGGLALAMMLAERDAAAPLPAAAALFSPWTDLAVTGASVRANERRCAMFTRDGLRRAAALYVDASGTRDPLVSPLYADLTGLPPMLIHASEDEILRDDSVRLAQWAEAAGVPVSLRLFPVVPHVWQLFYPLIPEGRESLQAANGFLAAKLE